MIFAIQQTNSFFEYTICNSSFNKLTIALHSLVLHKYVEEKYLKTLVPLNYFIIKKYYKGRQTEEIVDMVLERYYNWHYNDIENYLPESFFNDPEIFEYIIKHDRTPTSLNIFLVSFRDELNVNFMKYFMSQYSGSVFKFKRYLKKERIFNGKVKKLFRKARWSR